MIPPGTGVVTPKVRVLVADDAMVIVNTLAVILDLAGYDACAVYGGEAALRLLNLFQPDLVITDVTEPHATAMEVPSSASLALPRCRILLFTGSMDLHSLLRDQDTSELPFELVTRPILAADLLSKVKLNLCSEHPPLLVPIEMDEANVH